MHCKERLVLGILVHKIGNVHSLEVRFKFKKFDQKGKERLSEKDCITQLHLKGHLD